jgi:hypothetical protein
VSGGKKDYTQSLNYFFYSYLSLLFYLRFISSQMASKLALSSSFPLKKNKQLTDDTNILSFDNVTTGHPISELLIKNSASQGVRQHLFALYGLGNAFSILGAAVEPSIFITSDPVLKRAMAVDALVDGLAWKCGGVNATGLDLADAKLVSVFFLLLCLTVHTPSVEKNCQGSQMYPLSLLTHISP